MRKIIIFAIISGFVVTVSASVTATARGSEDESIISDISGGVTVIEKTGGTHMRRYAKRMPAVPTEIEGQVTEVKGNTLTITDQAGRIYRVKTADPRTLEDLRVGDIVRVEGVIDQKNIDEPGKKIKMKATSIERVGGNGYDGYTPESVPAQ
jgi:hypothetical protein